MDFPRNIAVYLQHDTVPIWQMTDRQVEMLRQLLPGTKVTCCRSEEAFLNALAEADCAMVWRFKQEWLTLAPHLTLLSTPAAGKDYFHIEPPEGLRMMYGQFHGEIIGETVVGFLLGMCRGILAAVTQLEDEQWPRPQLVPVCRPLRGSHVTLLGYGHIARWIEQYLAPFGADVVGVRHKASSGCIGLDMLEERLAVTDHLVVTLPGTEENRYFVDADLLSKLPSHATVVNVGRGVVIDEGALMAALENGSLAGAFLDVFEQEPLPMEARLRHCPNLWRMPHASAFSPDYLELYIKDFIKQLENR